MSMSVCVNAGELLYIMSADISTRGKPIKDLTRGKPITELNRRIEFFSLDESSLDPNNNYDFAKLKDNGKVYKRGGRVYIRPYGWTRVALNVKAKYKDERWLGGYGKGRNTADFAGEWPVSYHGTNKGFAEKIAFRGFDLSKGKRFTYGRGIYSTPDPTIAEKFASVCTFKGGKYKVLVQNRVNMDDTVEVSTKNFYRVSQKK